MGQYHHRNDKATARGKVAINYKRGRRVASEGERKDKVEWKRVKERQEEKTLGGW